MTSSNARIHAVLDHLETLGTPGAVLDAIPDTWGRFLTGPQDGEFHFAMKPDDGTGVLNRIYDRGHAMGRGATQMEAISAALKWIRSRYPRNETSPQEPSVPPYQSMLAASDLESARRRMLLIAQGKSVEDAYAYHIDQYERNDDLTVMEQAQSHLALLLAASLGDGARPDFFGDLIDIASGGAIEIAYGVDGMPMFRKHLHDLLRHLPSPEAHRWLAVVETDAAITRVIGLFASPRGATLACVSLLERQAHDVAAYLDRRGKWYDDWRETLERDHVIAYTPSNGMVDPRQTLRLIPLQVV